MGFATRGAESAKMEDKWEVEDALRTVTRCIEIRKDKKLWAKVKKLAAEKSEELEFIADGYEGEEDED